MLSEKDIESLGEVLTTVYPEPRTEQVPSPPPPAYEIEVEDEILDPGADGPRRQRRTVEVGAADYPVKKIQVQRWRRRSQNVPYEQDLGPANEYKIYSGITWGLSGLLLIWTLFSYPDRWWAYLPAALVATSGLGLYRHLKASRRRTATLTRVVWQWESFSEEVTETLDERYAPKTEEREIPNPERVVALGKIRLPFTALPMVDGCLVADGYGLAEASEIVLPMLEDPAAPTRLSQELEAALAELPIILSGERQDVPVALDTAFDQGIPLRGAEARLFHILSEIEKAYRGAERRLLKPNVLPAHHPLLPLLETAEPAEHHPSLANNDLIHLQEYVEAISFKGLHEVGSALLDTWARNTAVLSAVRFEALHHQVAPVIREFGHVSHYSSFNFYCPSCVGDQVEDLKSRDYSVSCEEETDPIYFSPNSRCLYRPDDGSWLCQTCERTVENPIPIHKLLDDVLFPAYDRLIEENKPKRQALDGKTKDDALIYTNRLDQETETLESQLHQNTAEVSSDIERIQAEMEGDVEAIGGIEKILSQYQLEQSQALDQIRQSSREIQQQIETETRAVLAQADVVFSQRRMEYRQEMQRLAVSKRMEDEVRDQILATTCMASLATAQHVSHIAQHTEDIAHSSRITAANTDRIAVYAEDIAKSSRVTAANTGLIAEHTEDIAQSSRQTAENTGEMKSTLHSIHGEVRKGNDIQAAMAEGQGIDLHDHSWLLQPGKRIAGLMADLTTDLTGGSRLDRARRKREWVG